jgi:alpha-L-fucosidase
MKQLFFAACTFFYMSACAQTKPIPDNAFGKDVLKHALIIDKEHKNLQIDVNKREVGVHLMLKEPVALNCLLLQENITNGLLIKDATVILSNKGEVIKEIAITTVGERKVITFSTVEASEIAIVITHATAKPELKKVQGYLINERYLSQ